MSALNTAAHVTISLLPVTLSLVHIPRSRLSELSRPILKQILQIDSPFLNLTCNQIELSIFAEESMLAEFEPIASRDRQRLRQRQRAASKPSVGYRKRRSITYDDFQPVETSFEKWNVLQIDSHEDSIINSGARVRELSAPLAAAGISILYQSSYMSDFIFVKTTRLTEVMSLLGAAGFGLYSSDPHNLTSQMSPFLSPTGSDDNASLMLDLSSQDEEPGAKHPFSPSRISSEGGAVLSRTRSSTVSSLLSLTSVPQAMSQPTPTHVSHEVWGSHSLSENDSSISPSSTSTTTAGPTFFDVSKTPIPDPSSRQPRKSMSPASAPVDVLSPDLACVGLNDESADVWSLKIVKLVAFPELIRPSRSPSTSPPRLGYETDQSQSPTTMYYHDEPVRKESLASDLYSPEIDLPSSGALEEQKYLERYAPRHTTPPWLSSSSSDCCSSSGSSSDEDAYFSSSPHGCSRDDLSASTPSLISSSSRRSSKSYPDFDSTFGRGRVPNSGARRPVLRRLDTVTGTPKTVALTAQSPPRTEDEAYAQTRHSAPERARRSDVPFFSFTRTAEGSSLTTDVRLLAALFPPHERHMVICPNELLETADWLENRIDDLDASDMEMHLHPDDLQESKGVTEGSGRMKCLQINLHKFGLDKHGLVNRFSRVLEENGINHMYSSTYKTANLLVDKSSAFRAQSLLRSC